MSVITRLLNQRCIVWRRDSLPSKSGRFGFEESEELICHWDDMGQEFRNAQGQSERSKATVYLKESVALGDMLSKGELDSSTPDDPPPKIAFEVRGVGQAPSVRAGETLYAAFL